MGSWPSRRRCRMGPSTSWSRTASSPARKALTGRVDISLLALNFSEDYPTRPPICKFPAGFFHVNVYPSGAMCLSILSEAWKPSITVRQILVGIQDLFENPNAASSAQDICYQLFIKNKAEYKNRVRQQAKQYPPLV